MKVLIVTVGGSDVPVVKAIRDTKPGKVIFICSEDSAKVIENEHKAVDKDLPPIIEQAEIKNNNISYEIFIVPADNIFVCMETASKIIETNINEGNQVFVDYTGGTKSMSAGLVAAALEFPDCTLRIVAGVRENLIKVKDGTERSKIYGQESNIAYFKRQIKILVELIEKHDYQGGEEVLNQLLATIPLNDPELEQNVTKLLTIIRALMLWDKFLYEDARRILASYKEDVFVANLYNNLSMVAAQLKNIEDLKRYLEQGVDQPKPIPQMYYPVYDLLRNAERKAIRRDYDDAIARIYRALEMYSQITLLSLKPPINPDNVQLELIPEELKNYYSGKLDQDGKIKVALKDGYDLLAKLKHPIGKVWEAYENKLLNVLTKRNYSFLAHGIQPLSENDYNAVKEIVWNFIDECDKAGKAKSKFNNFEQFPGIDEIKGYFKNIF